MVFLRSTLVTFNCEAFIFIKIQDFFLKTKMSHGYCKQGRRFDNSYKDNYNSQWHDWQAPAQQHLTTSQLGF